MFRRHILWTRLLAPRDTILPDGQTGDLLAYVSRERETLVIKPNRAYGVAIMVRASQKQVVNVAQRGGLCAIAIGHPPGRLIGPLS